LANNAEDLRKKKNWQAQRREALNRQALCGFGLEFRWGRRRGMVCKR